MSRNSSIIALSVTTSLITSALTFVALQIWLVPHLKTTKNEVKPTENPVPVEVPRVVGLRPDDAKIILKEKKLLLSLSKTTAHSTVEAGLIHTQTPLAGSLLPPGQTVVVEVSSGPPPSAVPLVVGRHVNQARAELERLGLVVSVTTREDRSAPSDTVLSQSIDQGKTITPGQSIELVVAVATSLVKVPDYKGKMFSKTTMTEELSKLGLQVGKVKTMDVADKPNGYIYKTQPEGGAEVAPGTALDFHIQYAEE